MQRNKVHSVRTISLVASELGETEEWLHEIAEEMDTEDGLIWVYSPENAYSDEVGRAYRPEVGHRLRCEAGRLYRSEAGHLRGPCLGRGGRFIEWCLRSSLECGSASFAKAFSAKIDAVSVVNDTVQDRVGQRGISDDLVPAVHGDLAGDEDGSAVVAILDDL